MLFILSTLYIYKMYYDCVHSIALSLLSYSPGTPSSQLVSFSSFISFMSLPLHGDWLGLQVNTDRDNLPVVAVPLRKITYPLQQLLTSTSSLGKVGTHEHLPRSWWIVEEPSPVQVPTDAVLVHDYRTQAFHSTAAPLLQHCRRLSPHPLALTISPFLLP